MQLWREQLSWLLAEDRSAAVPAVPARPSTHTSVFHSTRLFSKTQMKFHSRFIHEHNSLCKVPKRVYEFSCLSSGVSFQPVTIRLGIFLGKT